MRKVITGAVAAAFIGVFALPTLAQTAAPTGPADCKPTEQWDAATKTCKPR